MSKFVKGIAIFSTVVFGAMVVVGTAAASGASFPQKLERLSQIMSEGVQELGEKTRNVYGEGVAQFAKLFHAEGSLDGAGGRQAHGGGGGSGGGSLSGAGSGHPVFQPGRQHGQPGQRGGDGPLQQLPGLVPPPGSVITSGGYSGGGLSTGALIAGDSSRVQSSGDSGSGDSGGGGTEPPAKTPIPGAVWLLGSGLAGVAALAKSRRKAVVIGQNGESRQ